MYEYFHKPLYVISLAIRKFSKPDLQFANRHSYGKRIFPQLVNVDLKRRNEKERKMKRERSSEWFMQNQSKLSERPPLVMNGLQSIYANGIHVFTNIIESLFNLYNVKI